MSSVSAQFPEDRISHKRYLVYIPLQSEPQSESHSSTPASFTYCSRYIMKRRVMRNVRRMRRELLGS